MRELIPFALLACACGAAVRTAPPAPAPDLAPGDLAPATTASVTALVDPAVAFEPLAAQGPAIAPGMREAARRTGASVDLLRADDHDTCIRVAFEAPSPVTARLVDSAGTSLASLDTPATSGVLAPRGPVCIRRGELLRALAEGTDAGVHWMAWQSP